MNEPRSFFLSVFARLAWPAFLVLACVVFYRGHHEPGGGFIGGLIAALGFVLVALADGAPAARRLLRVSPLTLIGTGLGFALLAGVWGVAVRGAWLAGVWAPAWNIPGGLSVHLGTPLLFDLGVMLTVMGFSLKVVFAMEEVER